MCIKVFLMLDRSPSPDDLVRRLSLPLYAFISLDLYNTMALYQTPEPLADTYGPVLQY